MLDRRQSIAIVEGLTNNRVIPSPTGVSTTAPMTSHTPTPGHIAWRDFDHGSWYISEVCHTLCESSTHISLGDSNDDLGVSTCWT